MCRAFEIIVILACSIRAKPSHHFAITLTHYDGEKSTTGDWFKNDPNVEAIVVGQEKHKEPLDCDTGSIRNSNYGLFHQHLYIRYKDPMFLSEVNEMVRTLYPDGPIDIQVCRNVKSWLIYITKEDMIPYLYNIPISKLSFLTRLHHYAIDNKESKIPIEQDPFVINAGPLQRIAKEYILSYRSKVLEDTRVILNINTDCAYSRWISEIIHGQSKALYLYGTPGLGKTSIVDSVLRNIQISSLKPIEIIYIGQWDKYMFGSLQSTTDYIVFDDFMLPQMPDGILAILLGILDRRPVTVSQKFQPDRTLIPHASSVFISNFPIPINLTMFARRVVAININHSPHECDGCIIEEYDEH